MLRRFKKAITIALVGVLILWTVHFFKYLYLGQGYYYASVQDEDALILGFINAILPHIVPIIPVFESIWLIPVVMVFLVWLANELMSGLYRSIVVVAVPALIVLNLATLHSALLPSSYKFRIFFDFINLAPVLWGATIAFDGLFVLIQKVDKRLRQARPG